jgi:hypothetical protein
MPISRKLVRTGGGYAVYLPKSWVENVEKESGKPLKKIFMDVNSEIEIVPDTSS